MDAASRATWGVALVLVVVHLLATGANGFALPEGTREAAGASPSTTLARPWAHLTAPFFHYGLFHLGFNLALLALTMPPALRALGWRRALPAAYAMSPVAGVAVNLLVILPLAGADVAYAEAAVDTRLVGASVVAYAGAGMALVAAAPWRARGKLAAAGAVVAFDGALAALAVTQPFVGVYHVAGFALGAAAAAVLARR